MRVFGSKRVEPTDEDLAALARLSAVTARLKPTPSDADGVEGPDAPTADSPQVESGE